MRFRCLIVADFNTSNLKALLGNDTTSPQISVIPNSSIQNLTPLFDSNDPIWDQEIDLAIVWARPELALHEFGNLVAGRDHDAESLIDEVDKFCSAIMFVSSKSRYAFVTCWIYPALQRASGMLDYKSGIGVEEALARINLRMIEKLSGISNVVILNANRWLQVTGPNSVSRQLWYMAKIPYTTEFFRVSISDIKASINGMAGKSRKLLVTDLDDTIWGGVVGDIGWDNIRIGGHDPVGEAFADVQHALKQLSSRGILLAIVSKNDESVALVAIERNPEMILHREDFVGWRINWQDKAENIISLVSELNLGLDSVVYLDDNPVERSRIKQALPEVFVVDLPDNKLLFPEVILSLNCFDSPVLTREDRSRIGLYHAEQSRELARKELPSFDDWLVSLKTTVTVETLNRTNIARATQLLNKTNQMNLQTRRLTESEFYEWSRESGRVVLTFRVSDRFGDAGLTGILSLERIEDEARVADFVLSCRVMGRKIEETMLSVGAERAANLGCHKLILSFAQTAKNAPCGRFLERSGLIPTGEDGNYYWNLDRILPTPQHVKLAYKE